MSTGPVILAFSGGLDTSFCVPWLRERGHDVITLFVDTGGVDAAEREYIEGRALELGASEHLVADAAEEIWDQVVVPLVQAGHWYQDQYPLLCSDRYVVARRGVALCRDRGTRLFAHGCTAMGNDQVRFDLAVRTLGEYEILAPIREIQSEAEDLREFECRYLAERGFGVREKTGRYTINQNLLGVTVSGSEIDRWEPPDTQVWQLTAGPENWPATPQTVQITFEAGIAVALDGERVAGPALLAELNSRLGACGVGRGLYTGDTTVGLKGRIAFEAPGLTGLHVAHRALEEATCTRHQNVFKPLAAHKWVELVYSGFFYEPLKTDLEAYLRSSQRMVSGTVTVEAHCGNVQAVALDSPHLLTREGATYAQRSDWTAAEAEGFIKLFGQSAQLWTAVNGTDS